ncbi:ubiquinol cytochrome-c reductase assembly protein Cbp3 [Decorospora gaudefroyi]|uniref:Ubiquinol cytochrome-c reductase assembly protein Cbp3 n=1 Tax=Decorospora gaudefroyi TaxID=184978 RepID=A0A6A5KAE3_9PLEO|nr:ubiquinol cytochrome-c reductase assembly protein Cbp3 [Decorospora gaudefroyi]
MASNYSCIACSRALARSSFARVQRTNQASLRTNRASLRQAQRSLSTTAGIAAGDKVREKAPLTTDTYTAYGATLNLINECARPGGYTIPQALEKKGEIPVDENGVHVGVGEGWWYEALGLTPTFFNWSQITFLHMYMLQVRFRMLPQTHAPIWIQHLTNNAFWAAEDRLVVWHKFNTESMRQKKLKELFAQWRAVLLSYDEGLVKGDAMMAAAIWRNVLGAKDDVDFEKLAQIVGYMRRELKRLENATDEEVIQGDWTFSGVPGEEANLVRMPSRLMLSETVKI